MNKGIIIGIVIAIIIGVGAIAVSGNNLESVNDKVIPDEEISEILLEEVIKNKPKQFTVEITESMGFSGG